MLPLSASLPWEGPVTGLFELVPTGLPVQVLEPTSVLWKRRKSITDPKPRLQSELQHFQEQRIVLELPVFNQQCMAILMKCPASCKWCHRQAAAKELGAPAAQALQAQNMQQREQEVHAEPRATATAQKGVLGTDQHQHTPTQQQGLHQQAPPPPPPPQPQQNQQQKEQEQLAQMAQLQMQQMQEAQMQHQMQQQARSLSLAARLLAVSGCAAFRQNLQAVDAPRFHLRSCLKAAVSDSSINIPLRALGGFLLELELAPPSCGKVV